MAKGSRVSLEALAGIAGWGGFFLLIAPVLHGIGTIGDVLITDEEELHLSFTQICKYLEKKITRTGEASWPRDCIEYENSRWPELEEYSRLASPFLYAGCASCLLSWATLIGTLWKSLSASWKTGFYIVHCLVSHLIGALITTGLAVFVPRVTELVQGTLGYGVYLCAIAATIYFLHGLLLIVVIRNWVSYIRYKRKKAKAPVRLPPGIAVITDPSPFPYPIKTIKATIPNPRPATVYAPTGVVSAPKDFKMALKREGERWRESERTSLNNDKKRRRCNTYWDLGF